MMALNSSNNKNQHTESESVSSHVHQKYGNTFDDHYRIEERIHAGSYGTVYRVIDTPRQPVGSNSYKEYAVKIIPRAGLREKDELDIISEVNILRDLATVEHVVKLVDFFVEEDKFYIVQELARGGDVFERIDRRQLYNEHQARSVAIKLLQTVQKLHDKGILHRDIKPENILLTNHLDGTSILLADFGFATYLPKEGYVTRRCGTPAYLAPEVWRKLPYSKACDMWSIGAVLYMLISGLPPFYSRTRDNREIYQQVCKGHVRFDSPQWDNISLEAKELTLGLLTVDPTRRWTVENALQSEWIQSGLTDALFDNLDWMPKCSLQKTHNHSYIYSIEPMPIQFG